MELDPELERIITDIKRLANGQTALAERLMRYLAKQAQEKKPK